MSENVRGVCLAVRVDGVVTSTPLVAKTSQLSYDAWCEVVGDRVLGDYEGIVPVSNRPPSDANIRVETWDFEFKATLVAGEIRALIPEHRNAVKCPSGGDT